MSTPGPVANLKTEILSPFRDFSRPCRQENFPPRRAVHSLFRVCDRRRRGSAGPLFAVDAPRRELAPRFPAGTGADFSPASSDFKALGAFFCTCVILAVRQPEPRTVSRTALVPDLVGSRLPSPYHFRARIQSFQAVAAPFPGDSVLPSGPLAPRSPRPKRQRQSARRSLPSQEQI